MRGSIFSVLVAAVGAGIFLKGVDAARPSSPSSDTQAVLDVLGQLEPFAGLILMLFAIGALVTMTMARGF